MTAGILTLLATLGGLVLWWLKNRERDSPQVRKAKKIISQARARLSKSRYHLQRRDLDALEQDILDQERDLDILRRLHKGTDQTRE